MIGNTSSSWYRGLVFMALFCLVINTAPSLFLGLFEAVVLLLWWLVYNAKQNEEATNE